MKLALTVLLALHGAIHLIGFAKWSRIAAVPKLSGPTLLPLSGAAGQAFGVCWLLVFLALLAAAALRVARQDAWWMLALGGVLLSQVLVVIAWHDAKLGTIANALILVPALFAAAHAQFVHHVDVDVQTLFAQQAAAIVDRTTR